MIRKEVGVFLIVGSLTVGVDFITYHLLLEIGLPYSGAKALGFIAGTIFAYFSNKYWTFNHVDHGPNNMPIFVVLYLSTLGANVLVNQAVLATFDDVFLKVNMAFVIATGVSAILNFLGMKFLVFKERAE